MTNQQWIDGWLESYAGTTTRKRKRKRREEGGGGEGGKRKGRRKGREGRREGGREVERRWERQRRKDVRRIEPQARKSLVPGLHLPTSPVIVRFFFLHFFFFFSHPPFCLLLRQLIGFEWKNREAGNFPYPSLLHMRRPTLLGGYGYGSGGSTKRYYSTMSIIPTPYHTP
ncbi:hypothetical protein P167DRAFT_240343 [Morchella conica CCBAS932]|uniref:Uncharacterized protein n=1 Tax=Morchella conica CCBAS932 TaxID=1392247 RepID=A0A3N4KJS6_9PEZI|nr:hypothetical protein P167DRAFT_240343 [Morchella conica CCBAS932]